MRIGSLLGPVTAVAMALTLTPASAEIYGTVTLTTKNGETVSSDKVLMDSNATRGEWRIVLEETKAWTQVAYSDIKRVVISEIDDTCRVKRGVLVTHGGRKFNLIKSDAIDYELFASDHDRIEVTLFDPLSGGETKRSFHCEAITTISFPDNAVGSFRKSADGRYYPPHYVYDPQTGKKMELVDGAGRTSKKP